MTERSRRYTVVGAGAIGGTLAFYLAEAGHPVTVVDADKSHVAAIRTRGLRLIRSGRPVGSAHVTAITPDEVAGSMGRVLLAVKAQATEVAVSSVSTHLASDGFIVSMQNGLDNERLIAARVGASRTVGAFVDFFADVIAPGVVRVGGDGAMVVGELDGRSSQRIDELVADLQACGPVLVTSNVIGYLWSKLSLSAMLVATALADAPMADLIDRYRPLMHRLAGEVLAVAHAQGVVVEPFDAFNPIAYSVGATGEESDLATDALVAWLRTKEKTRSGIWRDIAVRRRPTEVPAHYKPVVDQAFVCHVEVPLLGALLERLARVESGVQQLGEGNLDDLSRCLTPQRARHS